MAKIVFLSIVALDQLSKYLIRVYLPIGQELDIIPGFFRLQQSRNKGAAWGMLANHSWGLYFLTAISIVAIIALVWLFFKLKNKDLKLAVTILAGGATGNLIDRIVFGEVVDFLAFKFGSYHFPNFNIADSAITIAAIFFLYLLFFKRNSLEELGFNDE